MDGNASVAKYALAGDADSSDTVTNHGGPQVQNAPIELVFWGAGWQQPGTNPSVSAITLAVSQILRGPYLYELGQYGFQSAVVQGTTLVTSPNPPSPYSFEDVGNMVWNLIDQGQFAEPDDPGGYIFFMVFMAPGTNGPAGEAGAHGDMSDYDFPWDVDLLWFGYVQAGDLGSTTETFTHELVEGITNPQPDHASWTMDRVLNGGPEIGDACWHTVDQVIGLQVQGYWSQKHRSCVIPWSVSMLGHSIRLANGIWSGLGDVNRQIPIRGRVRPVAAASSAQDLAQFMFATEDGHLWHTIRNPDGTWQGLGDVNAQFGIPGPVQAIAAASSAPNVAQFMIATSDGHLWHTIRDANGAWSGLGDVNGQFAIPGPVRAVAAASSAPNVVQFMFATGDGHLWHTIRDANGAWSGLGDVNAQFGIPGPVRAIGAASSAPNVAQFMFATADGHLWHTIRDANGAWSGLGDVNGQFAIPGPVRAIAAASSAADLAQFMFSTADGHLWHTIRDANGAWSGLGDVNAQFALPGPVHAIAAASSAPNIAQFMFSTE